MDMKKILFVCTGNTCRSPMAEAMLKQMAREKNIQLKVSSAGLCANVGAPISEYANKALELMGFHPVKRKAKQLTKEMTENYNLILTMTIMHKIRLIGCKNVLTLSEFTGCGEIIDPYGQPLEAYLKTAETLKECCKIILETLS